MLDFYENVRYKKLRNEGVFYLHDMDSIFCRILWAELYNLGAFYKNRFTLRDILASTSIEDKYGRWLRETFASLARNNYLSIDNGVYTVLFQQKIATHQAWAEWEQAKPEWIQDSNKAAQVKLVEVMLRKMPEILIGDIKATDIMFPNSSMNLVEGIYKNNLVADYFNDVLVGAVVSAVEQRLQRDATAKIRILEVGAGTGGSTAPLLAKLVPYREAIEEYCYTDLSKSFLFHAQREYGPDNPFLRYEIFNVEKSLEGQNIEQNFYDLAIAVNVLHATSNIKRSLLHVRQVLKKDGALIINELSRNALFNHLTFGFLDGWWLYEDELIRIPGSPAIDPQRWSDIAQNIGFKHMDFPAQQAHDMGQFVMHAQLEKITTVNFQSNPLSGEQPMKNSDNQIVDNTLLDRSREFFISLVAEVAQLPEGDISVRRELTDLGFDSILVVQLTNKFREYFDEVSSTLLFEVKTIDALIEHFIEKDKAALASLVGCELAPTVGADAVSSTPQQASPELVNSTPQNVSQSEVISMGSFSVRTNRAEPNNASETNYSTQTVTTIGSESSTDGNPRLEQLNSHQDIAIIGLTGTYPGAANVDEFWKTISQGKSATTPIPLERWNHAPLTDNFTLSDKLTSYKGGFIDSFDRFDAGFFDMSEEDAAMTDPQERKFLECAYATLEDAGYTKEEINKDGKYTGVYVGVMYQEYQLFGGPARGELDEPAISNSFSSIANRVSYCLGFEGPSVAVDSMCSSSLSAIHLACSGLKLREVDYAIAGGVNLTLHPNKFKILEQGGDLSETGQCRSFGEDADGYVPGEGVGAVLLKRLEDALHDGDHIYGVIKASCINHSGKTNGYTVPNPNSHAKLISRVIKQANIQSQDISYIEAHGTGTKLGDSIEVAGLTKVFSAAVVDTPEKHVCKIGSVKSNIGHCESASTMAGLTKILMQMKHQQIVPSLYSGEINRNIDFSKGPFEVPQALSDWQLSDPQAKRIAGLSSFGAGGSNGHLIIEEYKEGIKRESILNVNQPQLIVLSSKTKEALNRRAQQLLDFVKRNVDQIASPSAWLADIAYTLQVGRAAMAYRLAFTCRSVEDLISSLENYIKGMRGKTKLHLSEREENDKTAQLLNEESDTALILNAWAAKGRYENILSLWVKGVDISWRDLFVFRIGRRISLPTYPFAQDRYWLKSFKTSDSARGVEIFSVKPEKTFRKEPVKKENKHSGSNVADHFTETVTETREKTDESSDVEVLETIQVWSEIAIDDGLHLSGVIEQQVIVLGFDTIDYLQHELSSLQNQFRGSEWHHIMPDGFARSFGDLLKSTAKKLRRAFEEIAKTSENGKQNIAVLIPASGQQQLYAALTAYLHSLFDAYPNMLIKIVYVESHCEFKEFKKVLSAVPSKSLEQYKCSQNSIYALASTQVSSQKKEIPWREDGTYVLINGLSQTAEKIALEIQSEIDQGTIVLLGEKELDENIDSYLESLAKTGDCRIDYKVVDALDKRSIFNVLNDIRHQFNTIDGIVYVRNHKLESQNATNNSKWIKEFAPDVETVLNIDEAVYAYDVNLDFLALLPPIEELIMEKRSLGAATVNEFLRAFSVYRSTLNAEGLREGKTIFIDWSIDESYDLKAYSDNKKAQAVVDAFYKAFSEGRSKINLALTSVETQIKTSGSNVTANAPHKLRLVTDNAIKEKTEVEKSTELTFKGENGDVLEWLVKLVAETVKNPMKSVNPKSSFIENGLTSIDIVNVSEKLNDVLQLAISVVVFFEHNSFIALADYLMSEYGSVLEDAIYADIDN